MNFNLDRAWKSKRALRERLAAKPVAEKLRLLDAMRERALAIRAATPRHTDTVQEEEPPYGKNS